MLDEMEEEAEQTDSELEVLEASETLSRTEASRLRLLDEEVDRSAQEEMEGETEALWALLVAA